VSTDERLRVAVIGSGIAGLTAAYVISRKHHVTLFERDERIGGHAHTVSVPTADGRELGLDTGFIVMNLRTYPTLLRLFDELDVRIQDSDMSFGVRCEGCGLEYAGARGLIGVSPQLRSLARPRYLRMLAEIKFFHRHARRVLADSSRDRLTLGRFIVEGRYSDYFRDHFLLPLTGAIWSSSTTDMLEFPAQYLIRFFSNHGMLTVKGSPTWKTVRGGSRVYVKRVTDVLGDGVRSATPVYSLRREPTRVFVNDEAFDRAVVATHPDQALELLEDATPDEQRVLGAFSYSTNHTVLHTDPALLPRSSGARASWNYLLDGCSTGGRSDVHVTYHLNRLQALDEPLEYCVTLNQTRRIDPATEIRSMVYHHPTYTVDTVAAQRELPSLQGVANTYYCGAYHGWGFHEDGCRSGLAAARALGCDW
jgi:predicted NAD/FAD-binding protein